MTNQYVMAFDAGTGAGRCVLFDMQGQIMATAYQEWSYTKPAAAPEHGEEFSPAEFWGILCALSKQVILEAGVAAKDIIGVGTTSQREGMVFIDEAGDEIYAGPNIDMRGVSELEHLKSYEWEIKSITGLRLFGLYGTARLLWFKHNDPDTYARIDKVMMMSDWIAHRLSGVASSEPSVASSSQLLDLRERDWSAQIQEWGGFPADIFPKIFNAGELIGTVTQQASEDTGLTVGTAVAAGGGDTQIGLLGVGITTAKRLGAVAGTSTPLMFTLDQTMLDVNGGVSTNCYVLPDMWTLESNAGMTGMPYRWVRDTFGQHDEEKAHELGIDVYDYLNQLASEVPSGADGWRAFIGSRPAGIDRQSDIGGFLFPVSWILDHFDRRHLYRAAIETMAFGIRTNAEQLSKVTKSEINQIHISGGQTRSEFFNQMLANTLNYPVYVYQVKEGTALGAAICAAVAAKYYANLNEAVDAMVHEEKIVEPDNTQVSGYQEAYEKWRSLGEYLAAYPG